MPAINGTVTRDGNPLGGAYVRLTDANDDFVAEIYTKDDGVFTFHVVDGDWNVEARAAGVEVTKRPVSVGGGDTSVEFELQPVG
jgi:hypothetical protein